MLSQRIHRDEKGFTLIELLVVVAIIALLAVFAVPKVFDAIQQAKGARGNNDLAIIQAALDRFYMDHDFYPNNLSELVDRKYLKHNITFTNGHSNNYLYAVDNNTTASVWDNTTNTYTTKGAAKAYFLGDPGKLPFTTAVRICNNKDANGVYTQKELPEGVASTATAYAWKNPAAGTQLFLRSDASCGTDLTTAAAPSTLHNWRTDGFTE